MAEQKTISLNDLIHPNAEVEKTPVETKVERKPLNTENLTELKPSDIAPMKDNDHKLDPSRYKENHYEELIKQGIERTKKELLENVEAPMVRALTAKQEAKEFDGEGDIDSAKTMADMVADKKQNILPKEEPTVHMESKAIDPPATNIEENMSKAKDIEFNEDDFKETDNELDNDDTYDELEDSGKPVTDDDDKSDEEKKKEFHDLQTAIREFITPVEFDMSKYKISNNSLSINSAMSHITNNDPFFSMSKSVPLYNTGRTISFTPLTGSEIVAMSYDNYDNQLEAYRKTFNIMYNHDTGIDKTKVTYTQWMKSIDAGDISQLYFGLYNATFSEANYVGYQCPDCNKFFMKKKPITDMYSISEDATKEQKERFEEIKNHGSVEDNLEHRIKVYPLSKNYVIEVHPRTLFDMMQIEYLDDKFKNKYQSIIQPMAFISKIFYIDEENHMLKPIDMKQDHSSIVKTIKNKCTVIYKLISSIKPDEYAMLTGLLTSYAIKEAEVSNVIEYHVPEQDCTGVIESGPEKGKKCTHHFDKVQMNPYQMLFTRHQLAMQSTLRVE